MKVFSGLLSVVRENVGSKLMGGIFFVWLLSTIMLTTASIPEAQQVKKVWRIGLFHVGLDHVPPSLEPLRRELKKLGYEEGKNIQLDWRNLPDEDPADATAKEFVRNRVDLIVAFENQTARASRAATSEIPVSWSMVKMLWAQGLAKACPILAAI